MVYFYAHIYIYIYNAVELNINKLHRQTAFKT